MEQPISLPLHLRDLVVTKRRNIKSFVKSQLLFDVHRQYVQTFLIDLQAEAKVTETIFNVKTCISYHFCP